VDFADVLARRMNVGVIAVLLVAMVATSAVEMANISRAVANLALSAAVLGFVVRLWRECNTC
jgi:hypothetical protein